MSKIGKWIKKFFAQIKTYLEAATWDDELIEFVKQQGYEVWDKVQELIKIDPDMTKTEKIAEWVSLMFKILDKAGKTNPKIKDVKGIGKLIMMVYPYVIAKKAG